MTAVDLFVLSSDASPQQSALGGEGFRQSGIALHVHPADLSGGEPIGATLHRLLASSGAEFCAVLVPGCELLPGALPPIIAELVANPALGQLAAVGFSMPVDGSVTRATVVRAARLHTRRVERFTSVEYLAAFGETSFGLFVYRRAVLEAAGGFNARAAREACLKAALGIAEVAETGVHSMLACALPPEGGLAARYQRMGALLRRARRRPRHVVGTPRPRRLRLRVLAAAAARATGIDDGALQAIERLQSLRDRIGWRVIVPLRERAYDLLLTRLSNWPIGRSAPSARTTAPRRIAYYLWRYPVASETFIRRELGALRGAGVDVRVFADGAHYGGTLANHDDSNVPIRYVFPIPPGRLRGDLVRFALRHPLRTLNLLAYVVCRTYGLPKTLEEDVSIFVKSVHLAALLKDDDIEHVHAPWGDTNAFIALVAGRLAGATFSLQLRAHDLHRDTSVFLVEEKIRNARFVVTNTEYNRRHIETLIAPGERAKIRQIYNGLPVSEFRPGHAHQRTDGVVRLLSVARLIEPKGLVYLFEACDRLRRQGHRFVCEIIGGPELPLYVNDYLDIRAAHARLRLEGCVDLLGALPYAEVHARYEQADVFALPCVKGRDGSNDITPNAILEAMASGLPVVATDITAMSELVADGESGFLVPPRDVDALTARLAELIESPYLRARMGSYGRRRAEERFDIAVNVRSYVELFRSP